MAPPGVPTLFSAPAGFFDDALLFTRRDQALAGLPPASELGLGLEGLRIQEEEADKPLDAGVARDVTDETSLQSWSCHGCGSTFQSLEEQRSHFKSDFHKFNVKRKLAGKEVLNEDEFEQVAQGDADDVSSISGSDTETEAEDNSSQGPRSNQLYIKLKESEDIISIWRPLVAADKEVLPGDKGHAIDESATVGSLYLKEEEVLRRLRALTNRENKSTWVVLLAAGGHFAGLVLNSQDGSVLAHKTYHRYVVRAKAGGRQSTKDAGGRAPQSAGASLRRYNEQALQKEIRGLLTSWSEHLQAASHIFVYAPSSNAQTLFGGEDVVLDRNDRRIRKIPFTIRRPTMKEAKRISFLLSLFQKLDLHTLSVTTGIPDGVAALRGEASVNQAGKPLDKKKAKPHQVENHVAAEQVEDIPKSLEEDLGLTPLHVAAKAGDTDSVRKLLEEDSDPCSKDKAGRTPYSVAKDKETRNIFRRFMAQHSSKWDWHAASVPSPLTDELEAAQLAKQAEKDAKRKAKEKERKKLKKAEERAKQAQAEAKAAEEAAEQAAKAAAASVRYDKNRVKDMFNMSSKLLDPKSKEYQEAMLKAQAQERETRAAAAEFRLRALASSNQRPTDTASANSGSSSSAPQNVCSCCKASLAGKVPFTRYSYQYCSTTCVRVHKMALEEE